MIRVSCFVGVRFNITARKLEHYYLYRSGQYMNRITSVAETSKTMYLGICRAGLYLSTEEGSANQQYNVSELSRKL